jgi:hypothetical protein
MFQLAPITIPIHYRQLCESCGTDRTVFLCLVAKMCDQHVDVCCNLSNKLTDNFLPEIVTGDETWCFQYVPESK